MLYHRLFVIPLRHLPPIIPQLSTQCVNNNNINENDRIDMELSIKGFTYEITQTILLLRTQSSIHIV